MKKFILDTALFTTIALALIAVLIFSTNEVVSEHASFKVDDNINKVVLGHSHPECAFNDSLISNLVNFSESGESYFYTYYKLKALINQNEHIDTVFIEFTNNQISEEMNDWIWGEMYMSFRYRRYAPFIDVEGNHLLLRNNFSSYIDNLSLLLESNINVIKGRNFNYRNKIGGYLYLNRNKVLEENLISSSPINMLSSIDTADSSYTLSELNISYLEKIIQTCKDEKIKVYLIRSPMHAQFYGLKNDKIFKHILSKRFSNIEFLDFKEYPLSNDELGDLEHLNYRGAKKFSFFFDKLLKDGLLNKTDKQSYVNKEMAKFNANKLRMTERKMVQI